jgi:ribonucleases P/MRP protein subunit RPP40
VVQNGKESMWQEVLSSMPQGSVLGPLLFLLVLNDQDMAVSLSEILLKFADNTKLASVVRDAEDRRQLQGALDGLTAWSERWGTMFSMQKCKVMHMGHNNVKSEYTMYQYCTGTKLEVTREKKTLE